MSTSQIVTEFGVYSSSLLTAPGLVALLSFSSYPVDSRGLMPVVWMAVVFSGLISFWIHNPSYKVHPLLCLANVTFILVITVAVLLNVIAQLCPPQGRELALVPVYVLLCISRIGPSMVAYAIQGLLSVLVAVLFLFSTASRSSRPGDVENSGVEDGETFDILYIAEVFVCTFYACCPQLTGLFDWLSVGKGPEWVWVESKNGWYLRTGWGVLVAASIVRGGILILYFYSSNSVVYNFYYENSAPVSQHLMVMYGILLSFAAMQAAACWFNALQRCVENISSSAYTAIKIVRVQHILYALLVASAWIYPLQLASLRGICAFVLVALNLVRW